MITGRKLLITPHMHIQQMLAVVTLSGEYWGRFGSNVSATQYCHWARLLRTSQLLELQLV